MKAYKLMRLRKEGTLGSLFINRRQRIPVGKWLDAEDHRTKGYAHRPGWHVLVSPVAPHLSKMGRVWVLVEIKDFRVMRRPIAQGGTWYLADKMKVVEVFNGSPRI